MDAVAPEVNMISSLDDAFMKCCTASLADSYASVASSARRWTALWIFALLSLAIQFQQSMTDCGLWTVAALSKYTRSFPYTFLESDGNADLISSTADMTPYFQSSVRNNRSGAQI